MSVYQTAEQFYAVMREGFQRMAADPAALSDFQRRRMLVSIKTTEPEAIIVIDGRANPVQVSYDTPAGKADLGLQMPADLLHQILMQTAGVKASFMSGAVQVSGNVFRALQLADLFHQIQRVYPQVRQDLGHDA
ncbi:MAG: SCP2 sterol-binding domain-containing protein [Anaerolineae bacterium]